MSVWGYGRAPTVACRAGRSIRLPGASVIGGRELPGMSSGSWTLVLPARAASALNWCSISPAPLPHDISSLNSTPLSSGSRDRYGRGGGKSLRSKGSERLQGSSVFCTQQHSRTYELTTVVRAHSRLVQGQAKPNPVLKWGGEHEVVPTCWQSLAARRGRVRFWKCLPSGWFQWKAIHPRAYGFKK